MVLAGRIQISENRSLLLVVVVAEAANLLAARPVAPAVAFRVV
jgi:hypothetical protein